jgi:glutamate/aspartate transport system substrate-binding protein
MQRKPLRAHAKAWLMLTALVAATASAQQPAGNTLDKIQAARAITLGVRNSAPPFASIDAAGKPGGFTWELCQAVVRSLSDALKTPLEIKVVPVSLAESFDLLRSGKIDLQCGSTTHTQARAEQVDFSNTFFVSGIVTAYRTNDVEYASPTEFGRVGALEGSTASKAVAVRTKAMTQRNFKELVPFASYAEGVEMLKAGKIDTLVADGALLPVDPAIAVRRQQLTVEPYALMMRKGDTAFVKAVDLALNAVMKSPAMASWANKARLRVDYMTRDAWVHPDKTPAPPQF